MATLCCPGSETPLEHDARVSASQLKSSPIPIWWHRWRIRETPASLLTTDGERMNRSKDTSPFPKSWSVNYSGKRSYGISDNGNALLGASEEASCATDESSIYSTISQEQRQRHEQQRDEFGKCINHPHIQLARKKQVSSKSRFAKLFSAGGDNNTRREEWDIIHVTCPECEKEHIAKSKASYQYKPKKMAGRTDQQLNSAATHVPFPATLTLVESHPQLDVGTLALLVRSDPIPTEQTMHLSCDASRGKSSLWNTPDGALDFLLPADSNGEIIQVPGKSNKQKRATADKANSYQYQIMERVIPLSSIDHVSRGGDAWDVLRESTGESDFGCQCDVKIHGFSDRLLRFDVLNFDGMQSSGTNSKIPHHDRLRLSFAPVDFSRFSVTAANKNDRNANSGTSNKNPGGGNPSDSYTTGSVISKLNSIILGDRQARKSGVAIWLKGFTDLVEECLSLGVHKVDGQESSVNNTTVRLKNSPRDQTGRLGIDSNYV